GGFSGTPLVAKPVVRLKPSSRQPGGRAHRGAGVASRCAPVASGPYRTLTGRPSGPVRSASRYTGVPGGAAVNVTRTASVPATTRTGAGAAGRSSRATPAAPAPYRSVQEATLASRVASTASTARTPEWLVVSTAAMANRPDGSASRTAA